MIGISRHCDRENSEMLYQDTILVRPFLNIIAKNHIILKLVIFQIIYFTVFPRRNTNNSPEETKNQLSLPECFDHASIETGTMGSINSTIA